MADTEYLHGYAKDEQLRLLEQASYWSSMLIPVWLAYRPGARVLDIGCGAGAVLGVLAERFPGIELAGIDREPAQIDFARGHLCASGFPQADLRVGDAGALPWEDESFDHIYCMWFLEHMQDCSEILKEALRVLKRGGSIALTETDYTAFRVHPPSGAFDDLDRAQYDYFERFGNPIIGRLLGPLLLEAGFAEVTNGPVGFHFFNDGEKGVQSRRLRAQSEYMAAFLEPAIPQMAEQLDRDPERLQEGIEHLRRVPDLPRGSITQVVYRAQGKRS